MGKKKLTPIPYTPDEIKELIKSNPHSLYCQIQDNDWMSIDFLTHINFDGMETIYLLRSFYNNTKPKQKTDLNGQLKLL